MSANSPPSAGHYQTTMSDEKYALLQALKAVDVRIEEAKREREEAKKEIEELEKELKEKEDEIQQLAAAIKAKFQKMVEGIMVNLYKQPGKSRQW